MTSLLRSIRLRLQGASISRPPIAEAFARHRDNFLAAERSVRLFYAVALFAASSRLDSWRVARLTPPLEPPWPLAWTTDWNSSMMDLVIGSALALSLSALLKPRSRALRTLAFAGLLAFAALENSFGKISHSWHALLGIAFILIFLPDGGASANRSATQRQRYLLVFWSAQALFLEFYSLSGMWKALLAGRQWLAGEIHTFHPQAMANQISVITLQTGSEGPAGAFMIEHPLWGWLPYVAAVYFELFALWAAFRPPLQRFWGAALILMHIGIQATMGIRFHWNILLLAVFVVASPFAPRRTNWRAAGEALPLFGWLATALRNTRFDHEKPSASKKI